MVVVCVVVPLPFPPFSNTKFMHFAEQRALWDCFATLFSYLCCKSVSINFLCLYAVAVVVEIESESIFTTLSSLSQYCHELCFHLVVSTHLTTFTITSRQLRPYGNQALMTDSGFDIEDIMPNGVNFNIRPSLKKQQLSVQTEKETQK